MAERRMFTKKITDGDIFTAMPPTAQCLYFHLCMSADDDGFSNNIRIAMFNAHATTDDFNILVSKRFIIPFESGVIVIKHWKMHNYIQNDRYHETKYVEEKALLVMKENGVYSELDTECIQDVSKMDTEVRLGKNSIGKVNYPPISPLPGEHKTKRFVKPTPEEIQAYCTERGNGIDGQTFYDFYESKGWLIGKTPMKDWKAAVRTWERKRGYKGRERTQKHEPEPEQLVGLWRDEWDNEDTV